MTLPTVSGRELKSGVQKRVAIKIGHKSTVKRNGVTDAGLEDTFNSCPTYILSGGNKTLLAKTSLFKDFSVSK